MVSNEQLRARARATLGNQIFESQWMMPLLVVFVLGVVLTAVSAVTAGVATIFVSGFVMYAEARYFLGLVRKTTKADDFNSLIDGVKEKPLDQLVLGLLLTIFVALWSLLFVIPGIIMAYAYSMAAYVKVDHPEYSPIQAIRASAELMRGHKWQLFVLDLSFIGWYLLSFVTFGLASLWVAPYVAASRAEFYQELVKSQTPTETVTL